MPGGFCITAPDAAGEYVFANLDNSLIRDQLLGEDADGTPLYRKPVFDLRIRAQKKNPFSRMEQNELAKELYRLGFFSPDRAQEALAAMDLMEFEGADRVREKIAEGETLMSVCRKLREENEALKAEAAGGRLPLEEKPAEEEKSPRRSPGSGREAQTGSRSPLTDGIMSAKTPLPPYAQRLAKRSVPDADGAGK